MIVLFNKSDLLKEKKQSIWIKDYQVFLQDLVLYEQSLKSDFSKSLCLSLDTFYKDLPNFYVSSLTGEGL